ncbi:MULTISPECIES: cytochrome d ubiquinol oxidase subunit II [Flectobacillus]|jgi:cytochrome d ubiquinol oxidase subunit II|uniref:cytochrome d ubiquinol oxidase subunit II n=1 Tax=Flectobacillus TaxID=101 RepID=UPI000BA449EA|nr:MULTISPECIES: cytochrome d ubiquinol oxidase subunit II [Flectobacillus]MDI9870670.1 cytochrome d ubiquinol oxidase subunit II [Flectobacillus roseus]NBA76252.1 cytochrome d ubiquinol oxidase subunit II [Emticicia sp. ODNR4P]PAC32802.1 cytochrome d ubiquinol oxidase subunit II [Flectobacillus sp. BAB-3569]
METIFGLDLPTWWFLVVGGVFTGYAILDGFDLGAGALHLFFKKEESRRIALNAIGPVWDGNEVWLVIGGGALFAGFPVVYATVFSAFYELFMLFLVLLIFRAISIEFRSKEPMAWWRQLWDVSYSVSSIMLALSLGLVLGNIIQGLPIDDQFIYRGTVGDFFNPFSILMAITTLSLFMMHGAIYLVMKTENRLYAKLTVLVKNTTIFFVLMFALSTVYTLLYLPHMVERFKEVPMMFFFPVLTILAVANITRQITKRKYRFAFFSSAFVTAMLMALVAVGLFPNIVLSTIDPQFHIDIHNGASTDKSLKIMLTFAAIGVPLVGLYTGFVFWTFRGKVKLDETSY